MRSPGPQTIWATTVHQAMSTDPLYCFENESAEEVARKMGDWWVRRLPVVKQDKRLIGMVSLADLTILPVMSRRRETGKPSHRSRTARSARQTHGNTINFYVGAPRFLPPVLTRLGLACLAFNRRGHDILSILNSRAAEGAAFQLTKEGIEDCFRFRFQSRKRKRGCWSCYQIRR